MIHDDSIDMLIDDSIHSSELQELHEYQSLSSSSFHVLTYAHSQQCLHVHFGNALFWATKLCPVGAGNPSHWSSPKDFQGMYLFHASTRTFPNTTKPSCRITTNGESSCMALGGGALGHGYRWLGGYSWDECIMLKVMSNPNGVSRQVGIEVVWSSFKVGLKGVILICSLGLVQCLFVFLFLDWPALEYSREIYLKNGSHVSQSEKNCSVAANMGSGSDWPMVMEKTRFLGA